MFVIPKCWDFLSWKKSVTKQNKIQNNKPTPSNNPKQPVWNLEFHRGLVHSHWTVTEMTKCPLVNDGYISALLRYWFEVFPTLTEISSLCLTEL